MKLRVVNPIKLVRGLVVIFLSFYLAGMFFTGSLLSVGDIKDEYIEYTVVSGDTLWSIAKVYTDNNKDIRKTLYTIQNRNNNFDGNIIPGQTLFVPANNGDYYE